MADNPFPGLRPFEQSDAHLFFGREHLIHDMLRRLTRNRLLAVTGSSGCGKSSLVRAGMLEEIEAGFVPSEGMRWRVAILRPGAQPIAALAEALKSNVVDRADLEERHVRALLDRGSQGLSEFMDATDPEKREALLIVVDQFEEIFRYAHADRDRTRWLTQREEAQRFVELLLSSVKGAGRIYVVLTMRVDFLDDCASFEGLAEAVSSGQFLVPRLNREQATRAIGEPAKVMGGQVEDALLSRMLNDMATDTFRERSNSWDNPDLLPLMQHVLSRMWEIQAAKMGGKAPVLTLALYDSLGGLQGALSRHLNETRATLSSALQDVTRRLFTGLVRPSAGVGGRDIRNPLVVSEAIDLTGAAREQLEAVYRAFSGPGKNFLVLSGGGDGFTDAKRLDISHESLIRQWDKLQVWVREDEGDAELLNTLTARAYAGDDPPRGAALAGYLEVVERRGDTLPAFIRRYEQRRIQAGGSETDILAKIKGFLESGRAEQEKAQRDAAARLRNYAIGAVSVVGLVALVAAGFGAYQWEQALQRTDFGNRLLVRELERRNDPALAGLVLLDPELPGRSRFIEAGLYRAAGSMLSHAARKELIGDLDQLGDCSRNDSRDPAAAPSSEVRTPAAARSSEGRTPADADSEQRRSAFTNIASTGAGEAYAVAGDDRIVRIQANTICVWERAESGRVGVRRPDRGSLAEAPATSATSPVDPAAAPRGASGAAPRTVAFYDVAMFPRSVGDAKPLLVAAELNGTLRIYRNDKQWSEPLPADEKSAPPCARAQVNDLTDRGGARITSLAVDASGARIAVGQCDGAIFLHQLVSEGDSTKFAGSPKALAKHAGPVSGLRFLPNGELVSTSWDNTWRVYSRAGDQMAGRGGNADGDINGMDVSRDGSLLAGATDRGLLIWRTDGAGAPQTFLSDKGLFSAAFGPRNDVLIARSYANGALFLVNTSAGAATEMVGQATAPDDNGGFAFLGSARGSGRWIVAADRQAALVTASGQLDESVVLKDAKTVNIARDLSVRDIDPAGGRLLLSSATSPPQVGLVGEDAAAPGAFEGHQVRAWQIGDSTALMRMWRDRLVIYKSATDTAPVSIPAPKDARFVRAWPSGDGAVVVSVVKFGDEFYAPEQLQAHRVRDQRALEIRYPGGPQESQSGSRVYFGMSDKGRSVVALREGVRSASMFGMLRESSSRQYLFGKIDAAATRLDFSALRDNAMQSMLLSDGSDLIYASQREDRGGPVDVQRALGGGKVRLNTTKVGVPRNFRFTGRGDRVVGFYGSRAVIWDTRSGAVVAELQGKPDQNFDRVRFNRAGNLMAQFTARSVQFWSVMDGTMLPERQYPFEMPEGSAPSTYGYAISDDGAVALVSRPNEIAFMRMDGAPSKVVPAPFDCVATWLDENGSRGLLSCGGASILVDPEGRTLGNVPSQTMGDPFKTQLVGQGGPVAVTRFIDDSGTLAASVGVDDATLRVWSTKDRTEVQEWQRPMREGAFDINASRNGKRLMVTHPKGVTLVSNGLTIEVPLERTPPAKPVSTLPEEGGRDDADDAIVRPCRIVSAALHPDGESFAIADDCGGLGRYVLTRTLRLGGVPKGRLECESAWMVFHRCLSARQVDDVSRREVQIAATGTTEAPATAGSADESGAPAVPGPDAQATATFIEYGLLRYSHDGKQLATIAIHQSERGGSRSQVDLVVFSETLEPMQQRTLAVSADYNFSAVSDMRLSENDVAVVTIGSQMRLIDINTGIELLRYATTDALLFAAPRRDEGGTDGVMLVTQKRATRNADEPKSITVTRAVPFLSPFDSKTGVDAPLFTATQGDALRKRVNELASAARDDLSDEERSKYLLTRRF